MNGSRRRGRRIDMSGYIGDRNIIELIEREFTVMNGVYDCEKYMKNIEVQREKMRRDPRLFVFYRSNV